MNTDLVYIKGDLPPDQRERLFQLIRRVEQVGDFRDQGLADNWGLRWILVIGWGHGNEGPVSISRFGTQLTFTAPDAETVARKIERWIAQNADEDRSGTAD